MCKFHKAAIYHTK